MPEVPIVCHVLVSTRFSQRTQKLLETSNGCQSHPRQIQPPALASARKAHYLERH